MIGTRGGRDSGRVLSSAGPASHLHPHVGRGGHPCTRSLACLGVRRGPAGGWRPADRGTPLSPPGSSTASTPPGRGQTPGSLWPVSPAREPPGSGGLATMCRTPWSRRDRCGRDRAASHTRWTRRGWSCPPGRCWHGRVRSARASPWVPLGWVHLVSGAGLVERSELGKVIATFCTQAPPVAPPCQRGGVQA